MFTLAATAADARHTHQAFADGGLFGSAGAAHPRRSGLDADRPKLRACLDYVRDGLGRSTLHLLETIEKLKKRGVEVVFTKQPELSTNTPQGELMLTIMAAIAKCPYYPAWYLYNLGLSYHLAGQYDEAIKTLKQGIKRTPDNFFPHVRLAAVYSDLGRIDEARSEATEVLRTNPKFSIEAYSRGNPFKDPAVTEHRKNLFRQAGLPE